MLENIFTYTLNGLSHGMLIFLVASGLTLIFGLVGLINFAHGAMLTLGGYMTIVVINGTGSYWIGLLGGALIVTLFGVTLERTILHHLYTKPLLGFLATFGIAVVIEELLGLRFGYQSYNVTSPFAGSIDVFGFTYPSHRIFIIVTGTVIAASVGLLLSQTRLGMEVHATAVDDTTAELLGINSSRMYTITFALGTALAALAGGLTGPVTSLQPHTGMEYMFLAFLVIIVGGMGSFKGSLIVSLVVGQILAWGWLVTRPTYVSIFIFLAAMGFIVYKPRGLYGKEGVF